MAKRNAKKSGRSKIISRSEIYAKAAARAASCTLMNLRTHKLDWSLAHGLFKDDILDRGMKCGQQAVRVLRSAFQKRQEREYRRAAE